MKNVFRNKKRTAFVISGLALTYGMILFTVTMPSVVDQMMNLHFTEFQKMDYNIGFYKPVDERAVRDLYHIIPIDHAEGKIEYPFELSRGHREVTVNILGLKKDTQFYSFKDTSNRMISMPERGILLSENLAKTLKAEMGDLIRFRSLLTEKEDVEIPDAGVVKLSLGMNLKCMRAQLSGLEASYAMAKETVSKNKILYEQGVLSRQEYDRAVTAERELAAQISSPAIFY